MPKTINKFGFKASLTITTAAAVVCFVHYWLLNAGILPDSYQKTPFWILYFFLVPLSLLTIWFVLWRYGKDNTAAGRSYFITVFIKMFSSIYFLYPGVVVKATFLRETAIQFMVIFFILLFIETFLLIRLLNQPLSKKLKNDENQ